MGWLIAWLAFGMLAAYELSGLSARTGGGPALAIFYGAAGLGGIVMLVRRAVRRAHPAQLLAPFGLGLLGVALSTWLLHRRAVPPNWTGTFVMAAIFLALSSCVVSIGAIVAWRRREAVRDRRNRVIRESERQRLLERDPSSPLNRLVAELDDPPFEDEADLLPPRPPTRPK